MKLITSLSILALFLTAQNVAEIDASVVPVAQGEVPGKIASEVTCRQDRITLSPFFLLQKKDTKIWIERVIVTLSMTRPLPCRQEDLNSPAARKILYELLQSPEPEVSIPSQAMAHLSKVLGINLNAAIKISRATIIVH